MKKTIFTGRSLGLIFLILGVIFFIDDFNKLGSYNIYDPGEWPGRRRALIPFLPEILVFVFGIFLIKTKSKK